MRSEFSKNVLTLITGSTIAQAILIAISPILTRLYTPEDFGVLALFVAITSIFGSIANGRYELAIMLPKKDEDAINIFALGFIINVFITLMLFIIILIFHDKIVELLKNREISIWLYFIPISVFLMGIFNLLNYFNNRMKQYKDLAKANVYKSIGGAIIQLSLGLLKAGAIGLITGQIFSQIITNTKLFFNIKNLNLFKHVNKLKILAFAKRYKDFPEFSMWAGLLNSLSTYLINILISLFFSVKTLGFYSLAQRMLGMPSVLIGSSISQVYFKEAVLEKQQTGKSITAFIFTFKKLLLMSLVVFGLLFFFVEDIFAFIFGEEWRIAGKYAKILLLFYMVRFVSSSLSITTTIFEKQRMALFINLIILFSILLILLFFHTDFIEFLNYLSIILAFEYFVFLIYYWKLAKGS